MLYIIIFYVVGCALLVQKYGDDVAKDMEAAASTLNLESHPTRPFSCIDAIIIIAMVAVAVAFIAFWTWGYVPPCPSRGCGG